MAISVKKTNEAFELLRNYAGENPYMLKLQKQVYVDRQISAIKDFQVEFILNNYNVEPRKINKIVKLADWYSEKKQQDWELEFLPEKIKIVTYLGETSSVYVAYVQYRTSIPPRMCFLSKQGILTDFLSEDYKKLNVDFDRYSRLSKSVGANRELLDHQKDAVKFLLSRKKCILADGMGMGKTTSMAVAAIEGNYDSVLIICPASVKSTWKRELLCFVPERDVTIIESFSDKTKGELEEFLGYAAGKSNMTRAELLEEAKKVGQWKHNRFIIINYDILDKFFENKRTYTAAQLEEFIAQNPMFEYINNKKSLIIIDEAHLLSETKSIRYKTIKGLIRKGKPHSIFLATGTPITNAPADFYAVLNLIENNITGDWRYYMKRYCNADEFCLEKDKRNKLSKEYINAHFKGASWASLQQEQKDELDEYLHKNCRYVLAPKGDSNLDELRERISHIYLRRTNDILTLPPKEIHEIGYELSHEQERKYQNLWDEYEASKSNEDKELNKALLEGSIYRQYLSSEMVPHTIELTNKFIENGEKVIIGCCYDEELYLLQEHFGDKCVIYNGKMSAKQKDDAIYKFTNNPDVMVFIGNSKAASVGLTLIVSHIMIFNDFSYSDAENQQFMDRIHRIGQKHPCHVYFQFFRNTYYEKMFEITYRKNAISNTLIKKEDEK